MTPALCEYCGEEFDSDLNIKGEKRQGGPPKKFCKPTCKSKKNNTPGRQRQYRLKAMYGITQDEYDALLAGQGGVCAICGDPPIEGQKSLHVDHRHDSGEVRGILCTMCNPGLGYFRENPELLQEAIRYLQNSINPFYVTKQVSL